MNFFQWLWSLFSPRPAPAKPVLGPVAGPQTVLHSDWPKSDWDAFTVKALRELGGDLLAAHPKDANDWVKGQAYDPVQLYLMLLSALAKFESAYDPGCTYTEKFADAHGHFVVSRGLLQISIESANGNYGAGLTDAHELQDPETNIRVGVRIARKLILQDGVISGGAEGSWKGMARYWSQFRKPERLAYMQARTKAVC